jgi:tetratricopeptide (TPR) repeat protein
LAVAQYLLGKCLDAAGQKDEAIAAWAKLVEKYPESEPAPGTFFQRFNIYNERKDYPKCAELMDQFVKAYPEHENVYFAFNNQAEIIFATPGPAGKAPNMLENTRAGSKKLMEFVDYELQKDLKAKRGDQALVKIAVKWISQIPRKNFLVMTGDEKLIWQEAVDNATKAVEVILDKYADQPAEVNKVGDGLEKLVEVQKARTAADPGNAAKVAAYFKDLATKYDSKPSVRCNVLFSLGAVLWEKNRAEAMRAMNDGYKADVKFTTDDLDRYMEGLLADKKYDKVNEVAAKLAADYPKEMQDPQATALFWQGKVLEAQAKIKEAGDVFNDLKTKFGNSSKVLEADYGIIRAKVDEGKLEEDFISRLEKVFKIQHKTFEFPARTLLLVARVQEMEKDYDSAIENYIKIHTRYESVPDVSAEGLWRGANLLEKQAKKELPVMLPEERKKFLDGIRAKRAPKVDPAKPAEAKPADAKPSDAKPGDAKPADAKDPKVTAAGAPADATAAAKK